MTKRFVQRAVVLLAVLAMATCGPGAATDDAATLDGAGDPGSAGADGGPELFDLSDASDDTRQRDATEGAPDEIAPPDPGPEGVEGVEPVDDVADP